VARRTKPEKRKQARKPEIGKPRSFGVVWLTLASIVAALLVGEIAVRVIYGSKFGPRPVFGVGDRFLGWKPAPNLDNVFYGSDFEMQVHTDADGYRLGALGEVDYSDSLVVLLGDSYAFGWGLSSNETFASVLDSLASSESRGNIRLANLGVGGYGILQSSDRFFLFLRSHPNAKVRCVIVQHCINDAVDNIRSYGYHLGAWQIEQVEPKRHRLHLLNLIEYARRLSSAKTAKPKQGEPPPDGGDVQWSFRRLGRTVYMPDSSVVGGREIRMGPETKKDDMSVEGKTKLSNAQHEMMFGTLNLLHAVCARLNVPVVHTFITTTPRWYVDEVTALAEESGASQGCRVIMLGEFPLENEFAGPIRNANSAGHFNAKFSRFWAQRMAGVLEQNGIF